MQNEADPPYIENVCLIVSWSVCPNVSYTWKGFWAEVCDVWDRVVNKEMEEVEVNGKNIIN